MDFWLHLTEWYANEIHPLLVDAFHLQETLVVIERFPDIKYLEIYFLYLAMLGLEVTEQDSKVFIHL